LKMSVEKRKGPLDGDGGELQKEWTPKTNNTPRNEKEPGSSGASNFERGHRVRGREGQGRTPS